MPAPMPAHSAPGSSSGSETGTVALGSSAHVGCRRPRRVGSVHAAPAPWPSDQTQASTSVPGTAFPRVWPVPPGNRRDQWTHFHLAPVGEPTVSPRLSRGSLRPGGGGHPTHIYISDSLLLWVFPPMVPWAQETHSKGPSLIAAPPGRPVLACRLWNGDVRTSRPGMPARWGSQMGQEK